MFAFADTDHQRAAFSGGDDRVRSFAVQQDDDVSADNAVKGDAHGLFRSAVIVASECLR